MHIYDCLKKLAKSQRAQNLFSVSKELPGIRLFRNECDFSKIQEEYLLYLYMYEGLARDIELNKISKHVYDKDLYEEAYLLWKKEKGNKEDKNAVLKDVKLVIGTDIKFPKPEGK
jgi:hypothetical protein